VGTLLRHLREGSLATCQRLSNADPLSLQGAGDRPGVYVVTRYWSPARKVT